jgi:putative N6-adenine-specific DNA methylase
LFAVAAPGLEGIVAGELQALGMGGAVTVGGVDFQGPTRALYLANLHLRAASRVLLRLGEFNAAAFSELRTKASRLRWEAHLRPGQPVAVKATSHKSRLYHSDAVAERVVGAISDRLGRPVVQHKSSEDETPTAQLVIVRLVRDWCTVSLDSSGALLHERGYRLATAKAPLRETLAAGLVLACGWDPATPLLDPFCGAGTIPIEAALLALNVAPGHARRFAFMDWPGFDARLWRQLLAQAASARRPEAPAILGADRDQGAIAAAQANAERAGVGPFVRFERRTISALEPPAGRGWVVTNPPYGVRVQGGSDLRNLYARLGSVLRARCPGWHVALLSGHPRLAHSTGLRFDPRRSLALVNGGLRVTLWQGQVEDAAV